MGASGLRQHEDSGSPRGRKAVFHLYEGRSREEEEREGETEQEECIKEQNGEALV